MRRVRRVLVTGVSGVGKSTTVRELARRGLKAVDLDDPAWSEWVDSPDGDGPSPPHPGQDWLWRADRVGRLLATQDADVLVVGGCAPNLGAFRDRFDVIVLLSDARRNTPRRTSKSPTPAARTTSAVIGRCRRG